jgi:Ulp1 family protease
VFCRGHRAYFATSYVLSGVCFERDRVKCDDDIDKYYRPKMMAPFNLQHILDARFIVLPANSSKHWTVVVVDVQTSVVHYFDSTIAIAGSKSLDEIKKKVYERIVEWVKRLQSESNRPFDQKWNLVVHHSIPQQKNWWDCGVFLLAFLNHLVFKGWTLRSQSFCQKDLPSFRRQLIRQLRARDVAPLTVRSI